MFLLYKQTEDTRTKVVINVQMLKLGTKEECIEVLKIQYYEDHYIGAPQEKLERAFEEGVLFFDGDKSDYYKITEV